MALLISKSQIKRNLEGKELPDNLRRRVAKVVKKTIINTADAKEYLVANFGNKTRPSIIDGLKRKLFLNSADKLKAESLMIPRKTGPSKLELKIMERRQKAHIKQNRYDRDREALKQGGNSLGLSGPKSSGFAHTSLHNGSGFASNPDKVNRLIEHDANSLVRGPAGSIGGGGGVSVSGPSPTGGLPRRAI